tara:strand:- start:703 stop:951 length:249 start_codon:yes stop_codon:yes gene_type:complete
MNIKLKTSSQKSDEEKNFSNRSLKRLSKLEKKSDNLEKEYLSKDEYSSKKQVKSLNKQNRIAGRITRINKRQEKKGRINPKG